MFDFSKISEITSGKIISHNHSGALDHFLTDSRRIVNPKVAVFVAIEGQQHDGHQYLKVAYNAGVRSFVIEKDLDLIFTSKKDSNILLVGKSIEALQKIARYHRIQFDFPVIGITGSNGKTIVKEWLGQLLAQQFEIVKSPKSYNSQLGVPLSVLQMTDRNNLGIFEAGISTTAEMSNLQKVIQPTVGIFTNIGPAHDEGFSGINEKAREKWQLFLECDKVIYCIDHQVVEKNMPECINGLSWGKQSGADVQIIAILKQPPSSLVQLKYGDSRSEFKVPFIDDVSLENVMHCISLLLYLNIPKDDIDKSLRHLDSIEHRLSLKKGINNCYLVDDSYSNDLAGLQIAIDFMKSQVGNKQRVILSDVLQSGLQEKELFKKLNEILMANNIKHLVGIGSRMVKNSSVFKQNASFYESTEQFLSDVNPDEFQNENILIKGARTFQFERITNFLSEKIHGTVLEINLEALLNNLNFYRSKLKNGVKIMVMVKASAYGSGSHEIANLLQHNLVDYLAVAYPDEGVELRKRGIHLPMMVMNVAEESFDNIMNFGLEPEVYSIDQLKKLIRFIDGKNVALNIHLKIDSGMHRLGFEHQDIEELISLLSNAPFLKVASVYSHLAGADEEMHDAFTNQQVVNFLELAKQIENTLNIQPIRHILNSAGIIRFPEYQLDMVRLGIGLYGYDANQLIQDQLQSISTLKTVISQIRNVKRGDSIGYGRKGVASKDAKIATIAIGYADGFSRSFSNGKISLLVNGKLAPVIGNVCMDMSMLDITGIDAKQGDDVIVFGENPSIKNLADAMGTIPYEILTRISSRVPKVFYYG